MTTEIARETRSTERRALRQGERGESSGVVETLAADGGTRKRGSRRRAAAQHVVFLVPGLLGFENFASFGYFADRVVAALRAALERAFQGPVPVLAVPIPPTARLLERQRRLVRTLADRLHELEHGHGPLQVHLVGHSTGGLDANLLTHDRPLQPPLHERPSFTYGWADLDPRAPELRRRIRSVISIASPHQGACIARDPLARALRDGSYTGLGAWLPVLAKFGASVASDFETKTVLSSALREGAKTQRFVARLLRRWELLDDLQPTRDPRGEPRASNVLRRSFVTIAGRPVVGRMATPLDDAFFREVSRRAAGWETGAAEQGPLVAASVARLRRALESQASELVLCAPDVELPRMLDAGHNDGIVNSARQLIDPDDPEELAGIVVSDHFDVVGYYDRHVFETGRDGHERRTQLLSGLLHSGSAFRDDQFFELYRRVAEVLGTTWR